MATQVSFHAMKSAVQMDFVPAKFNEVNKDGNTRRFLDKHGWLLIQMAMGDKKVYDWNNKVTFALGIADLPHIYQAFINFRATKKMNLSLVHDPNAGTDDAGKVVKTLRLQDGQNQGTYALSITQKKDGQESRAYHYLKIGELKLLENLFNDLPIHMSGISYLSGLAA